MRIARLEETKILQVSYQDSDPNRAGFILEQLAQGYIEYSRREQQSAEQRGLSLIEEQLPMLRSRVEKIQDQLQAFRQQHNIINPETLGEQLTSNLTELIENQQAAAIQIQEQQSLNANLQQQLGLELSDAITTVALSQAPRYQELLNQLQEVETQIALELTRFQADSPNIQVLEERRASLLELLRQEAIAVLDTPSVSQELEARVASPNPIRLQLTQDLLATTNRLQVLAVRQEALSQAEVQLRSSIEDTAILAREYKNIQRELQVATESLNRFLALRERLQIEAVQQTLPWQLLEAPQTPRNPIAGDLPRGLLLGAIAGLAAGAGAAYLVEKLDNKFHSTETIKEKTGLPLLGVVPFQKGLPRRFRTNQNETDNASLFSGSQYYQSFPFLESFRSLHTNLSFMSPDRPIRSLVISSCVPKEGKTTTSFYLAQAAAAMGQKVLLVDADLRRPQLHQIMELPNTWGLSNVISSGLDLDEAIQPSPLNDNLYVLTSGPLPPDPTCLLSSQTMKDLIEQWQQSFDLVIFDSPPLGGLADAKLLAAHTNGMALVTGLGVAEQSLLKEVLETLRVSRTRVLGIIANGLSRHTTNAYPFNNYYYRYYNSSEITHATTTTTRDNAQS